MDISERTTHEERKRDRERERERERSRRRGSKVITAKRGFLE